jgi:hypothetical protein
MDEQNHQTSRSGSGGSRPADSRVGSTIAYYGDAARVREGFAIALGLVGLSAGMVDGLMRNQPEEGE